MSKTTADGDQSFVSPEVRAQIRRLSIPIATAFGRAGITPNGLTIIGFGIAIGAGIAAATGAWFLAGLLVIGGGVFDLFDGALARATNKVSVLGAFFDSTFDRWGEAVVYVGIVAGCASQGYVIGALLSAIAMSSSFLVSYTRAKAESIGFHGEVGVAPRAERLVILTAGLIIAGLMGGLPDRAAATGTFTIDSIIGRGALWLDLGLGIIAALATITVIQRIVHVRTQALRAQAANGRELHPEDQ